MKAAKSERTPFAPRVLRLVNADVKARALAVVQNAPLDPLRPLEVVVREVTQKRKNDQNALMFAGPLRDIADQAWLEGRQFSVETWHEYFKRQLLPEMFDPVLCLEHYRKWDMDPAGDRVLVGSTTQLTVKGMAEYIEQIMAFGGSMGVQFSARENQ